MNKMKKYFTNLFDPQLLLIVLVAIAFCIIFSMIFSQKTTEFKQKYKSKFYIYLFSITFVYAIISLLGYNKLFSDNHLYEFIFYQICSLIIGIIHCYAYRAYFDKFGFKKSAMEYLFCFAYCILFSSSFYAHFIPFLTERNSPTSCSGISLCFLFQHF